jgi:AAA domain
MYTISSCANLVFIVHHWQAVEVSCIISLKHGPKAVVLVGDPAQVTSITGSYYFNCSYCCMLLIAVVQVATLTCEVYFSINISASHISAVQ